LSAWSKTKYLLARHRAISSLLSLAVLVASVLLNQGSAALREQIGDLDWLVRLLPVGLNVLRGA
jgi:hypothetical protein